MKITDHSLADAEAHRQANAALDDAIHAGLNRFNHATVPDPGAKLMTLAMHDEAGELVGGLTGRSAYGWLRVDVLWVDDPHRRGGHGAALLAEAERIATARGCRSVHLDTHGFQAPDFYRRLGYTEFGRLPDYPQGYSHSFFYKDLYT